MFSIKVTADKLQSLSMLADWQLSQMGIDPRSVAVAALEMDDPEAVQLGTMPQPSEIDTPTRAMPLQAAEYCEEAMPVEEVR